MTGGILAARQLGPAVRELVPAWFVQVFVVLTELGNVGLFLVVFALDYWFLDRERGAHAIGLVVGGMALITALKFHFAAPRPPASVTAIPISGFSFPSGHAMGAAVAYGTLAVDLDVGSWKQRFPVAGALIAFVALSRVVLGVHFVRDVVAGVLFGLGFVVVAFALTKRDPRKAFFLAVALGAVAFVVSGASSDGIEVLGSAIGGTLPGRPSKMSPGSTYEAPGSCSSPPSSRFSPRSGTSRCTGTTRPPSASSSTRVSWRRSWRRRSSRTRSSGCGERAPRRRSARPCRRVPGDAVHKGCPATPCAREFSRSNP